MIFHQRLCANCGYSLRGHEVSGRCPECGEMYSPDLPVIFGWQGGSSKKERGTAVMGCSLGAAALFGLTMIACFLAQSFIVAAVFFVLMMLMLSLLALYRKFGRKRRRPNRQLRLTPEGYGFRPGFGPVEIYEWVPELEIHLMPESRRFYRLRIVRRTRKGAADMGTMVDIQFRAADERLRFLYEYIVKYRGGPAK